MEPRIRHGEGPGLGDVSLLDEVLHELVGKRTVGVLELLLIPAHGDVLFVVMTGRRCCAWAGPGADASSWFTSLLAIRF